MFRVLTCLGTEHDWRLVIVAAVVCLLSSLTAVSLFARSRAAAGLRRATWIAAAGTATGFGIWATHFIAMLAYDPGVPIAYNIEFTVLSLIAAILITTIGLAAVAFSPTTAGASVGGGIVGAGVGGMHYLGMSAVELPGRITWAHDLVIASLVFGVVLGFAALLVAVKRSGIRALLLAALLLTLAIVLLHFTAMGAVTIVPDPTRVIAALSMAPASLALAIAGAAIAVLGMSLASAFVDRLLGDKRLFLDTALNNMTQGVAMFDAAERLVLCNDRYMELYDLPKDAVKPGTLLLEILQTRAASGYLKRDPDEYRAEVMAAIADGKAFGIVIGDAGGREISVVNRPITNGEYWISTHEDITERRAAERTGASLVEQKALREATDAAIKDFRASIDSVLKTLGDSTAAIRATTTELASSSNETVQSTAGAADRARGASTEVEVAALAADEMAKSLMEIDRQLSQARSVVSAAVTEADETNNLIATLANAAQRIGDVVKLIQTIAAQTNLLALNATIEAARAGQAGRGFSVVAAEVKSLSVQTANATEEIAAQIQAVQSSTGGAVEAIRRIGARMNEIDDHTASIAASVAQQNAATSEISHNVTSAAEGAKAAASILGQVTRAVGKAADSAGTVLAASQAVENAAARLREKVDGFLRRVAV